MRSSCDMLARNSDLYFDVSASCLAFSSSACRACSTSWFLRSTSWFWCASRRAFSCSSSLVCCSSCCRLCSSCGQRLRLLEQVLRSHVGFDRVEHDADRFGQLVEERLVRWVEAVERGQLQHAAWTWPSNTTGRTMMFCGARVAQARGDADVVASARWSAGSSPFPAHTDRPAPRRGRDRCRWLPAPLMHSWQAAGRVRLARRPYRGRRRRACCAPTTGANSERISRPTVSRSFCPCSMRLNLARLVLSQSCSVFFCVVSLRLRIISLMLSLSAADFALRLDGDRRVRSPLRHGRGHLGDGTDLRRQVRCELVDILRQILPGAGGARHLGLAAQLAFDAHLARHASSLGRQTSPACRSCR